MKQESEVIDQEQGKSKVDGYHSKHNSGCQVYDGAEVGWWKLLG